ncbi:hypothetical protein EU527_03195 [Candidatus Thorarchaeota archaeon]|nr:MAG: hypothetical protein EU527_03195 [Candidatus Thorarchaeota archaeon]
MLKRGNLIAAFTMVMFMTVPLIFIFLEEDYITSPYVDDDKATFSGNIVQEGDSRIHSMRIYDNVTRIHCVLTCGGADFDLYGRFGERPSIDEYDFIGYSSEGENVYYDYPESGILHLMVRSYSGIGHYNLLVELEYSETEE